MTDLRRVCVFCGSSSGTRPVYAQAAAQLGTALADAGVGVVYGGGNVGLMGAVATAALDAGAEVIGVIPQQLLEREIGNLDVTELHVVDSMHERKAMMADLSDAFVALPGGLGTLEELFEVATWSQLGLHVKPVALLDVDGFFGPLTAMLDHAVAEGFVRPEHRRLLLSADGPEQLLDALRAFEPPPTRAWIGDDER